MHTPEDPEDISKTHKDQHSCWNKLLRVIKMREGKDKRRNSDEKINQHELKLSTISSCNIKIFMKMEDENEVFDLCENTPKLDE